MICRGSYPNETEYLNKSGYTATVASFLLSNDARYNGLLHKDRLVTFNLSPPQRLFTFITIFYHYIYLYQVSYAVQNKRRFALYGVRYLV